MFREIRSVVTGTVYQIEVTAGDQVKLGDDLVIVESMKMEIPVLATEDGTITEFATEETEPVSEGQVVVILET